MGLAASQGRYLCLTARMNDLIYEGQQISQQKMALAKATQAVADEYSEAMNNTIIQTSTPEGGQQRLTYDIITSQDPFNGLCMRIVDTNGNVVVPQKSDFITATTKDEDGNEKSTKISSSYEFVNLYMTDLEGEKAEEASNMTLEELVTYYNANYKNSGVSVEYTNTVNAQLKNADEKYLYDENCKDPAYLQEMLETGQWMLEQVSSDSESGWEEFMWQGSKLITETYDTSDDRAAEAKYESAMRELQKQDKLLDLRLEQVQTEESAVEKEIDSIKQIIEKNIEDSFGTFA